MTNTEQTHYDRQVAQWLLFCAVVIFAMILLGGATRLTNSGLSMVEWKPLVGAIPPLTEQDWQDTFDKYKQFPEYQQGVSCHRCIDSLSEEQKARFAERERQIRLAEARGEVHVGGDAARIIAERKARKKLERERQAEKNH